jgi:uncharacterized membrane-anchored protein
MKHILVALALVALLGAPCAWLHCRPGQRLVFRWVSRQTLQFGTWACACAPVCLTPLLGG